MSELDNIISVICCVMPSGETLWVRADSCESKYIVEVLAAWKEQNPEYTEESTTCGFVEIRMPEERYNLIPATNGFVFPKA